MTVKVKTSLVCKKINLSLIALTLLLAISLPSKACPNLANFYSAVEESPAEIERELSSLIDECSESSEYYALLGAVQLASGDLFRALESLELALLYEPDNGSALVDYAEVLYRQGDVLSALELNEQLMARQDLPLGLKEGLSVRQRRWRSLLFRADLSLATALGYDNNLNNAPVSDRLALTLSGRPVTLEVSPEYQAQSGSYTRLVVGANIQRRGRSLNTQFLSQVRGRFGEGSEYELLQASTQLILSQAVDNPRWDVVTGFDHVAYGRNSIFTGSVLRARYLVTRTDSCGLYPKVAFQYQNFHAQRSLTGLETSLGFGVDCSFLIGDVSNRFAIEASSVVNRAAQSHRLGEDRRGSRINFAWSRYLLGGEFSAQYVWTKLDDEDGYSPLFDSGRKREETLNSIFLQYQTPLSKFGPTASFFANLSYYSQDSTIDLFQTRGSAIEIGINWGI